MMQVTKRIEFDAGHRVARHGGQCANPHGHRYMVDLTVEGVILEDGSDEHGMVVDFGRIKAFLTTHVHDRYDHGFIVEVSDTTMRAALSVNMAWKVIVVPFTPTAENLAESIGRDASFALRPLRVASVVVFETPSSSATWTR